MHIGSSYVDCACRDCFSIAISGDGKPALCSTCEEAGCDNDGGAECRVVDEDALDAFVDVYGDTLDEGDR